MTRHKPSKCIERCVPSSLLGGVGTNAPQGRSEVIESIGESQGGEAGNKKEDRRASDCGRLFRNERRDIQLSCIFMRKEDVRKIKSV